VTSDAFVIRGWRSSHGRGGGLGLSRRFCSSVGGFVSERRVSEKGDLGLGLSAGGRKLAFENICVSSIGGEVMRDP